MALSTQNRMYTYGSAAPKVDRPDRVSEKEKRLLERKKAWEIEKLVRANRVENSLFTAPQMIILISAIVIFISFLSLYLVQISVCDSTKAEVASLQQEYQTLIHENALKEGNITKEIDYGMVYRYATEVLHMSIPASHQVVYYDDTEKEYVVNNGVIPNE